MPVISAAIDPVTRLEGHLKVDIKVDVVNGVQQIVDVKTIGTLFRGFEKILENRDPRDAMLITSRICGVCPTSHALTAALNLEQAFGVSGDTPQRSNARLLRNLVHGACYLESHLLHFYLLCLPDYVPGLPVAPWLPGWNPGVRVESGTVKRFQGHLVQSLTMRRNAHEMGAIFGGKLPHTPSFIAGGVTTVPSPSDVDAFRAYLNDLTIFIQGTYIPDTDLLGSLFREYFAIGRGYGNLLSYGVFEQDNHPSPALLFQRGRILNGAGSAQPLDASRIAEHVTYSWYNDADNNKHPSVADTIAQAPKGSAYSWLKSPRYDSVPYECGPLARMWTSGQYDNGISVMDRHRARAREALLIAQAMNGWLNQLAVDTSGYTPCAVPTTQVISSGMTEAPRGALGHWSTLQNGKIAHYQVITPTCWTISPRDTTGQPGPLEKALLGTPVANVDQPVEALRVIHSVDPCLDCATHVMRADAGAQVFALGMVPATA